MAVPLADVLPAKNLTQQGPPVCSGDVELRAVGAMTTSYVPSSSILTKGWNSIIYRCTYVKGALETDVYLKPEGSSDGGTTWYPLSYKAPQGSGVSEITPEILHLTPANFAASDSFALPPLDCRGHTLSRISVKQAGGTPGTFGIKANVAMDIVNS